MLGAAGLAVAALAHADSANAQSRENYPGNTGSRESGGFTSRGGSYAAPSHPTPLQRPPGWQRQQSETDGLLEDAMEDLARGRLPDARRLLEMVIEQFGNTASADEARRLLAPIYANLRSKNPSPGAAAASGTSNSDTPRFDPVRPASVRPFDDEQENADRKWKSEVVRVRLLEQDLRSNVGDRIFFGEGSAELGARSRVVLAAQAAWLKRYPELAITVEGHADDHGSQDFNRDLAEKRAHVVRDRLVTEGVEAARIGVEAMGRENPVAPCQDAACAAQNRRVVTHLVAPRAPAPAEPRSAFDAPRRN